MLEELMRECRNWFVAPNGVHLGTFTIKDGSISLLARRVCFVHPVSKEEIRVEAPLPDDTLWKALAPT